MTRKDKLNRRYLGDILMARHRLLREGTILVEWAAGFPLGGLIFRRERRLWDFKILQVSSLDRGKFRKPPINNPRTMNLALHREDMVGKLLTDAQNRELSLIPSRGVTINPKPIVTTVNLKSTRNINNLLITRKNIIRNTMTRNRNRVGTANVKPTDLINVILDLTAKLRLLTFPLLSVILEVTSENRVGMGDRKRTRSIVNHLIAKKSITRSMMTKMRNVVGTVNAKPMDLVNAILELTTKLNPILPRVSRMKIPMVNVRNTHRKGPLTLNVKNVKVFRTVLHS